MPNRLNDPDNASSTRRSSRRIDARDSGGHASASRGSHARSSAYQPRVEAAPATQRSSRRAYSRAQANQVHTISPSSTSRESDAAYVRRTGQPGYVEGIRRRARRRRVLVFLAAALVVVAVALAAGFFAFRGTVGSEMALKNSDAAEALVSVRSEEPFYALIAAELGAVAEPLEQAGPDVVLLAYVDREAGTLSLVGIPPSLQVSHDNAQRRLGDVAELGDAAFIRAVQNFAKVDISHYVKIERGGIEGIVDALGGIDMEMEQVVDDPHAGDVYLPLGSYTLSGPGALTYLRATNVALGVEDQMNHQLGFAARVLEKVFDPVGSFVTRIEALDAYFQTDQSLADLEALAGLFGGIGAEDIRCTALPGYMTSTAGVVDVGDALFVCSSSDMARIIESLEGNPDADGADDASSASVKPGSFTIEVQNGTDIAGAAGATAEALGQAGFKVEKTGNAEQQVYTETLVVYKTSDGDGVRPAEEGDGGYYDEDGEYVGGYDDGEGEDYDEDGFAEGEGASPAAPVGAAGGNLDGVGLARANAVIGALGLGRAVEAGAYYFFDTDILVIIGSDYKPVA